MMAHALTALRLLLIVPTALGFALPGMLAPTLLLGCIVLAIVTDYLDGKLARWAGTATPAGQTFDHATDFLFVTIGLAGAAWAGLVTAWLPLLIAVAFSQYVLDSRLLYREKRLRMSFIGRWNGILYFLPLLVLAIARLEVLEAFATILSELGRWLAWLLLITTVISILDRAVAPLRNS